MDRLGADALGKPRDIGTNDYNVDTLYVLSSGASDTALSASARPWQPDLEWVTEPSHQPAIGHERYRILELWWD